MKRSQSKKEYLHSKYDLLEQFGINITLYIMYRIEELYPNDIAIENYTRKLILERLSD